MAEPIIKIELRQTERGWDVIQTDGENIWPTTSYPNSAKAAARVLQLMELTQPVTPQNWPERVCIGFIETDGASGGVDGNG